MELDFQNISIIPHEILNSVTDNMAYMYIEKDLQIMFTKTLIGRFNNFVNASNKQNFINHQQFPDENIDIQEDDCISPYQDNYARNSVGQCKLEKQEQEQIIKQQDDQSIIFEMEISQYKNNNIPFEIKDSNMEIDHKEESLRDLKYRQAQFIEMKNQLKLQKDQHKRDQQLQQNNQNYTYDYDGKIIAFKKKSSQIAFNKQKLKYNYLKRYKNYNLNDDISQENSINKFQKAQINFPQNEKEIEFQSNNSYKINIQNVYQKIELQPGSNIKIGKIFKLENLYKENSINSTKLNLTLKDLQQPMSHRLTKTEFIKILQKNDSEDEPQEQKQKSEDQEMNTTQFQRFQSTQNSQLFLKKQGQNKIQIQNPQIINSLIVNNQKLPQIKQKKTNQTKIQTSIVQEFNVKLLNDIQWGSNAAKKLDTIKSTRIQKYENKGIFQNLNKTPRDRYDKKVQQMFFQSSKKQYNITDQ